VRVLLSFSTRIGTPGIGTIAWHQATGLASHGAEVHVACGSVERDLPGVEVALETMRIAGLKVPYRLVGFERATELHDWRVAKMLLARTGDFDVVHAWPAGAERTLEAARASGVPAFLERPNAHTAYAFDVVQQECTRIGMALGPSSPHAFNAAKLAREEREFAAADALLCPSEFVLRSHADQGEPTQRLLRHRYGYDPVRFIPPAVPRAADARLEVVFLGRLEPRKGVHLALEAWRLAGIGGHARLRLIGSIEPGYESVLAPLLDQPGVELGGYLADPSEALRQCDALVLPSLEEGSALVTYEARACGAVLLVSDCTGAPAEDGVNALVHGAGDTASLARHLRLIGTDHVLRARLREHALDGIGDLTWDAAAGVLLDAYAAGAARLRSSPVSIR
jgi:D-inositol-3-phosphate glycosyltransferase